MLICNLRLQKRRAQMIKKEIWRNTISPIRRKFSVRLFFYLLFPITSYAQIYIQNGAQLHITDGIYLSAKLNDSSSHNANIYVVKGTIVTHLEESTNAFVTLIESKNKTFHKNESAKQKPERKKNILAKKTIKLNRSTRDNFNYTSHSSDSNFSVSEKNNNHATSINEHNFRFDVAESGRRVQLTEFQFQKNVINKNNVVVFFNNYLNYYSSIRPPPNVFL